MAIIWTQMPYQAYQFSGEDADDFLQGQLTSDVKSLKIGDCQYGAYCNPKGRMLANFLLSRDNTGSIVARIHQEQAESTIKRLQMFKLRSKVNIDLLSLACIAGNKAMAELICQHYKLPLPDEFSTSSIDNITVYALPNGYYEVSIPKDDEVPLPVEYADNDAVEFLRLQSGNFHVLASTNEFLLPQQTILEQWGAISYTKGCYVGQEIIARNKYLGVVKKGLAVATIKPGVDCEPKATVYHDDKPVGQVIEAHSSETQTTCLCLLSLASMGQTCQINDMSAVFHSITNNSE